MRVSVFVFFDFERLVVLLEAQGDEQVGRFEIFIFLNFSGIILGLDIAPRRVYDIGVSITAYSLLAFILLSIMWAVKISVGGGYFPPSTFIKL